MYFLKAVFVIGRSWFLCCGCLLCGLPGLRFVVFVCVAWVGFRGRFGGISCVVLSWCPPGLFTVCFVCCCMGLCFFIFGGVFAGVV